MKKGKGLGVIGVIIIVVGVVLLLGTVSVLGLRYYWVWKDKENIKKDSELVDLILEKTQSESINDSSVNDNTVGDKKSVDSDGNSVDIVSQEVKTGYNPAELYSIEYNETESLEENVDLRDPVYLYPSDISEKGQHTSAMVINALRARYKNDDIVGYLIMNCKDSEGNDIRIEYPVLHGETNDTYIHAGPDKEYLYGGSIFIDSGNNEDFTDSRTSVYGHNMRDGSMFGKLKDVLENDWTNLYFTIYSEKGILNYKIIGYGLINGNGGNFHLNPSKLVSEQYQERGMEKEKAEELSKNDYTWDEDMYRVYLNSIQWDENYIPKIDEEMLKEREWDYTDKLAETEFEEALTEQEMTEDMTEVDIIHGYDTNDTYEVSSFVKSMKDELGSKTKDISEYKEEERTLTEDAYLTTLFTCYKKSGYRLTATGYLLLPEKDKETFETVENKEIKSYKELLGLGDETETESEVDKDRSVNDVLGDVTEMVSKILGEEEEQ